MSNIKQLHLFNNKPSKQKNWFTNASELLNFELTGGWPDRFGQSISNLLTNNHDSKVKALSLFSGAGGLDIGFHDSGFDIIECNEIEEIFSQTLKLNSEKERYLSGSKIKCMDIRDYEPKFNFEIDFIIGGPPCQTFSAAGARAAGVNGTDDERGNLFLQYARILKLLNPKGFLFENVYRIVGAQNGKPWKAIQETFNNIGYKLFWKILDAADYGVPQFRERLFIIGLKIGEYSFPQPSHGPESADQLNYYTARDAIENISIQHMPQELGGRHGYLLNDIPPGLNYSFYTDRMGHPKPIFGWRSKFSDYLYKADPETPVRTIKAQGGQYTGPFSWENRPFSIEELKRLQTFPDDYLIFGNRLKIIHQLGNSVPPQLARILALSIRDQVFNGKLPFQINYLHNGYELGFRKRKRELTEIYLEKAKKAISLLYKNFKLNDYAEIGVEFAVVNDNLTLQVSKDNKLFYTVSYDVNCERWKISLKEDETDELIKYKITLTSNASCNGSLGVRSIEMISYSARYDSILLLWKFTESLANRFLHKDDLVQFLGYYQCKNMFHIEMQLVCPSIKKEDFWTVLKFVTFGQHVGQIKSLDNIADSYNISADSLFNVLNIMKNYGFEIRNQNTNKQIPNGMILIPYCFPTLNVRSLQRLTEL